MTDARTRFEDMIRKRESILIDFAEPMPPQLLQLERFLLDEETAEDVARREAAIARLLIPDRKRDLARGLLERVVLRGLGL